MEKKNNAESNETRPIPHSKHQRQGQSCEKHAEETGGAEMDFDFCLVLGRRNCSLPLRTETLKSFNDRRKKGGEKSGSLCVDSKK